MVSIGSIFLLAGVIFLLERRFVVLVGGVVGLNYSSEVGRYSLCLNVEGG